MTIPVIIVVAVIVRKTVRKKQRGGVTTTYPQRASMPTPPAPVYGSSTRTQAPPQDTNTNIVVQNIGQYIAGDTIDIRDSVVQRSEVGIGNGVARGAQHMSDRPAARGVPNEPKALYEQYKKILAAALEDGCISPEEERLLTQMRRRKNLTWEKHQRALAELSDHAPQQNHWNHWNQY